MAFTRFHDDDVRIQKQLEEMTFVGRYMLDVPGQGIDLPFMEDPQIRMQTWGANLQTNVVNVESDLKGLTRTIQRDDVEQNDYTKHSVNTSLQSYPTASPFVEESRSSHPAWMYRDMEHPRWEMPWINPQANLEKKFHDNIQTRILEKDYYRPQVSVQVPCVYYNKDIDPTAVEYYLTGKSVCLREPTV